MWNSILEFLGIREKTMNKFWIVYSQPAKGNDCYLEDYCWGTNRGGGAYTSKPFKTIEDATKDAKQRTASNLGRVYVVLEAMSASKPPVPDVEMETLTLATTPAAAV